MQILINTRVLCVLVHMRSFFVKQLLYHIFYNAFYQLLPACIKDSLLILQWRERESKSLLKTVPPSFNLMAVVVVGSTTATTTTTLKL